MNNFLTRVYSISDILEWNANKQLELSPRFQRRAVWTDNARSYLMDTIIRGKPMPKVFIRERINPSTKTTTREVVDGQQRLRTVIAFLEDGFVIKRGHNTQYGSYYFSQLADVDPEIQTKILKYEIAVDLLVNMDDPDVLDVFSRLNSYAVLLNEQERLNANHFGPFKTLADGLGHMYLDFWLQNKILTDSQIVRMGEAALVSDLLIAMIEGIKAKKSIKYYYDLYEVDFLSDVAELEQRFHETMAAISSIFPESIRLSEFRRIHLFYSLFTAVFHMNFGIKGLSAPSRAILPADYPRAYTALKKVDEIFFNAEEHIPLTKDQQQFLDASRRATTDTAVRIRRTEYLAKLMFSQ